MSTNERIPSAGSASTRKREQHTSRMQLHIWTAYQHSDGPRVRHKGMLIGPHKQQELLKPIQGNHNVGGNRYPDPKRSWDPPWGFRHPMNEQIMTCTMHVHAIVLKYAGL